MERIPKEIYTPKFRAEAVKLVESEGLSVDAAVKWLSVPKSSLANWIRASREGKLPTVGQGQRVPMETEIELARLRKELAEVKLERDLLKNVRRILRRSRGEYARIEELRQQHPVAAICRILDASESGHDAWRQRPPSARTQENARPEAGIKAAHQRTYETYGLERLPSDLADHVQASVHRIKRIRTQHGLRCKQKRKFKATTNSSHVLPVAPNLLYRQFAVAAPNRAWVTDMTDFSAASRSALPVACVVSTSTTKPLRFSIRACPI